ncbi:MAG: insulinase family protein [Rhodospirillaceae bacterium]|jgi:zinc protease|nr:insulinase family protein [Rhodospirillaceae bacterium]
MIANPWKFVSLATAVGLCLFTGTAWAGVFNPETFTLKNGMDVVVVNNPRVPVVTHMVWYRVGSADEGPGESGIAHFLEHLMFKGTKARKPGEFSEIVARNGGRENAFTSHDYTAYYQTIAVDRLETVMALEADRMTNLVITPNEVEPERQVVLEERRSRTDNNPGAILGEHVNASLFLNHPYRNPIIGWEHDIKALDINRILAFYKRFYRPNNAILVVAGDMTAAKLRPLAEKYYGVIPVGAPVARSRAKEPPQKSARRVVHRDKRVRQPSWRRTFVAPGLLWGDNQHSYPLEVLADIVGSGASSRLYRKLVVDSKLAVSAGAYYSGDDRGPGRFVFYASPRGDVSMPALEKAMEAEIAEFRATGVTADELKRAKGRMLAEAIYARDSLSGGARSLGSALAVGISVAEVEAWPERIAAVTRDQITAAARATFDVRRSVTGLLLPEGAP